MQPSQTAGIPELAELGQGTRRYSDDPLPAYRFLPGLTPHPITHPQGHSHGISPAVPEPLPPEDWAASPPYLYGCDLYNRGYWWEAHEAWEGLWQVTRAAPAQHRFLQGLIQAANAQLKLALAKPQAVRRLWAKAEAHWQAAGEPVSFMGLELADWRSRTWDYLTRRLAEQPLRHDSAAFPVIKLQHLADEPVVD